jgi:hypothetical protein
VSPEEDQRLSEILRLALQALRDYACDKDDRPKGTVIRLTIAFEEMMEGETRRMSWLSRGLDNQGLYPWETLGLLRHALLLWEQEQWKEAE